MIGDPSFKSAERNLLDKETLNHNINAIKSQLAKFLDFEEAKPNKADLVNNYDWMAPFSFLELTDKQQIFLDPKEQVVFRF